MAEKKSSGKRIIIIFAILIAVLFIGFFAWKFMNKNESNSGIVLENPLKDIILASSVNGAVNEEAVVEQGIKEFNAEYINYLLIALGVNNLHKSLLGYGNPVIEMNIDGEVWSSELEKGVLHTEKKSVDNEDLIIKMSKEEAVKALLDANIKSFMKNSVIKGNTQLEMVGEKVELFSKGYLDMYKELTE